jgi:hypothetical protein
MKNPQALPKQSSSQLKDTCGDAGNMNAGRSKAAKAYRSPAGSEGPASSAPDIADEVVLLGLKA